MHKALLTNTFIHYFRCSRVGLHAVEILEMFVSIGEETSHVVSDFNLRQKHSEEVP